MFVDCVPTRSGWLRRQAQFDNTTELATLHNASDGCNRLNARRQRQARIRDGAEITWTVCTLPSEYLDSLAAQIASDFKFGFNVADEIMARKGPTFRALAFVPASQTILNAGCFGRAS
jgi:hypothetical protein